VDLTPRSPDAVAAALARASRDGLTVDPRGGGTKSRRGLPGSAGTVLSTAGLTRVVDHAPGDMTLTVEAGLPVAEVAALTARDGQWWPQAEERPGATVGGVLAAAASARGRLRHGPVRDSLLEVVLATGDGRLVKGGGRTVKGVAGYDLPRLVCGSLGTLGVIVQVTLKLWPRPAESGWYCAEATAAEAAALAARVMAETYRPASVVLTPQALWVALEGAAADVAPPAGMAASEAPPGLAGAGIVECGVPPARLADLVAGLAADGRDYEAWAGVGTCLVAVATAGDVAAVRERALALDGHAQVVDGPPGLRADPFGPPPPGLAIMRRLKRAFDPAGVMSPGRFVGDVQEVAA
jgi:glycolate oxidase FAD binding subunit